VSVNTRTLAIGDLSIAVHDSEGSGPAIVLLHGNSTSSRAFERQLGGPLGRSHRLVAVDLPGHGASSSATDPARTYTLPGYARVLVQVVRRLELPRAIFFGWSLGAHVVLEASGELPHAAGFAIMGAPPIGFPPAMDRAFLPLPAAGVAFREAPSEDEVRQYLESLFKPGTPVPDLFVEDFRRTDGRARSALAASIAPGGYRDEVEVVGRLAAPLAILHGARERIVNRAYFAELATPSLWGGAVRVVPDAGHAAHWDAPAEFDALVAAFARDCTRLA
jgi:pimeloyl-ACP methyl ester carboxylesterase